MVVEIDERIRVAAYLLWESRGKLPDCAVLCWLEAERHVLRQVLAEAERRLIFPAAIAALFDAQHMHRMKARNWTSGRWP